MTMTGLAALSSGAIAADAPTTQKVIELRQYKILKGRRDAMIALFEREFVESQEALGMRIIGQFRDLNDPDRFIWVREFESMAARATALNAFYFGPVWQAHRDAANALLDDNDNVLLLHPAAAGFGFGPLTRPVMAGGPAGLVIATIHYLWKDAGEGFGSFFQERMQPALTTAGLPVLSAYVPEREPNNFPRLPVRQSEKLFVWFTRVPDAAAYNEAMARLRANKLWHATTGPALDDFEERAAQILRLAPASRSTLR
ncbi:NIPSNAP family protein [Sphingomonas sp. So64.6b]|uniref:putative quinol monooxygenase n=1 Tax=Sphingomonas sp. So64.6b TaxID=2997354 RepID=UPI001602CA26|nr:NIPSNAP family protein [Sphingomonas sp. So64.6b]QNA82792.1 NIPSNAP family protein [Sphingomonas sp. So64.6b]